MDDLLNPARDNERLWQPIAGDNPSGTHLRNQPAHDQIKRAVAAADAGGAEPKALAGVVSQACDLLIKQSKDLEIASCLTAALAWTRGLSGTLEGLNLLAGLVDRFWDTIYPLAEDGDEGLRSGPLQRTCKLLVRPLLALPVVESGAYSVQEYLASRSGGPPEKETVDLSIQSADRNFYATNVAQMAACREQLEALQQVCNSHFSSFDDRPDFQPLFSHFDRVGGIFESILESKPEPVVELPVPPSAAMHVPEAAAMREAPGARQAGAAAPPAISGRSPEESVLLAAAALFESDHADPVPYLLIRGLRFGKLIAAGTPVPAELLEAPASELRTGLRRALLDSNWDELLRLAEEGVRSGCGGSWLDLHFRAYRACKELGLDRPADAISGALLGYLRVLPDLPEATMVDGTPVCSPDTLEWLRAEVLPDPQQARLESMERANAEFEGQPAEEEAHQADAFQEAAAAFAGGDFPSAFGILTAAWSKETCGRARLQRRIQQAQIAMEAGRHRLALPLLREICRVVEERRLESWESAEWVGHPLAMLCRCLDELSQEPAERQRAYERLCAIDPDRALELDSV